MVGLEKVLNEVHLLRLLQHENLVSYYHVWLETSQASLFGPPVPCVFILQQYCDLGDLETYVNNVKGGRNEDGFDPSQERARRRSKSTLDPPRFCKDLPFDMIYSFFVDITTGLTYLHRYSRQANALTLVTELSTEI